MTAVLHPSATDALRTANNFKKNLENPISPRNPQNDNHLIKSSVTNKSKDSVFPSRDFSSATNQSKSDQTKQPSNQEPSSNEKPTKVKTNKIPNSKSIFKSTLVVKNMKKSNNKKKPEELNKFLTGSTALKNIIKTNNEVPLSTKYSNETGIISKNLKSNGVIGKKLEVKLLSSVTQPITKKPSKQNSGNNSKSCSRGTLPIETKPILEKKKSKVFQAEPKKGKTTNNSPNHFKMLFKKHNENSNMAAVSRQMPKDEHYESFHTSVEGSYKIRQQSNETALSIIRRDDLTRFR